MNVRNLTCAALVLAACATPQQPPPAAEPTPAPAAAATPDAGAATALVEDPNLWLEDVTGEKPLAWVKEHNKKSTGELTTGADFEPLRKRFLSILDSKDKIPYAEKQAKFFYNFWRDDEHQKGLWRRVTSIAEYKKPKPNWETVVDLDALSAAEKESWVWKGATCLYPKYERCMLKLSRGGADAVVVREYDTVKKAFVTGGFTLPEAKSEVQWKDLDTLYVGTDFGAGTLTDSGYPRITKEWKRGTPLTEAKTIFEGQKSDVVVSAFRSWDHGHVRDFVNRAITFFESEWYVREGDQLKKIDAPTSVDVDTWDDQILIRLRDDWAVGGKTWPKGSYLATGFDAFIKGGRDFTALFEPAPNKSFNSSAALKSALIVSELEDVRTQLYVWTRKGGKWSRAPLPVSGIARYTAQPVQANDSDEYWFITTGFTQPTTLELAALGKPLQKMKASPSFFDATGLTVEQHFAASKDGTKIPYFQVSKKELKLDGQNPTLLTAYGGFEVSIEPYYDALTGAAWLEKGGVFVSANIRGGGEYGPAWHQAGLKTRRQNIYDDMIAVSEDLISRKVTSTPKLGIEGGSNGGLLMGVMLTERPDLFGAIVCQVPLLDMKRYHLLLAGASWMGEYGDPNNPEEWAALAKFSPYQNVKKDGKYPRTLFTTSTRDDRVHPGHARKMVARMEGFGHDILYYENVEGGHGGAANNEQRAFMNALAFTFLSKQLGLAH
jgi:prolyl oligopeptidase